MPAAQAQPDAPQATRRTVPESAFRLDAGRVEFQAGGSDKSVPIRLVARTGGAINHWYWGPVVHDLDGLKAKERLVLDWCHWQDEQVGYVNQIDTESGDLVASGALVAFREDDRASEIMHKGRQGVPYEASIYFDPLNGLRIEEVQAGVMVTVNGRQLTGPLTIFRAWTLRGIALCPYGADPSTQAQLSQQPPREIEVTVFSGKDSPMAKDAKTDQKPDAQAAGEQSSPPPAAAAAPADPPKPAADQQTDPVAEYQAKLAKFVGKFGAEDGVKWCTEGKSYEQALELFADRLTASAKKAQDERGDLAKRLSQIDTGDTKPVSFSSGEPAADKPAGKDAAPDKFELALGKRVGGYARSLEAKLKQ